MRYMVQYAGKQDDVKAFVRERYLFPVITRKVYVFSFLFLCLPDTCAGNINAKILHRLKKLAKMLCIDPVAAAKIQDTYAVVFALYPPPRSFLIISTFCLPK